MLNQVNHPVLHHKLSLLRHVDTKASEFRQLVKDISSLLAMEASKDLTLTEVQGVSF